MEAVGLVGRDQTHRLLGQGAAQGGGEFGDVPLRDLGGQDGR
jgi:hypothetical protein